jgi:hypothetical protein
MDLRGRSRLQAVGLVAAGLAVVALAVAWFLLSPAGVARRDLHDARATWTAQEPSSYAFDYFYCGGMCALCLVHVTVTDGVVVDAVRTGQGCSGGVVRDAPTIEDMFEVAADHQPGPFARSATVTYDPTWGFPVLVQLTCPPDTMDCGGGWEVRDFEVLAE